MSTVLELKQVSKKYTLGGINSKSFTADLRSVVRNFYKGTSDSEVNESSKDFWAVKDISFTINQGESFALFGKNGAGKSTLLKLISRITSPTYGDIYYKGKLSSLLEVGTGFHPELTGRENIYLNGAILGMRRSEINDKFNDIIEFSGIGAFIDTPVKRYSSGMYVRLAFSVAAHLESDILILDEVLAVGDSEFQKRCANRIRLMAEQEGRTVIYVGHNQSIARMFCNKAVLLDKGQVKAIGDYENISLIYGQDSIEVKEVVYNYSNSYVHIHRILVSQEILNDSYLFIELDILEDRISFEVQVDVFVGFDILITTLIFNCIDLAIGKYKVYFDDFCKVLGPSKYFLRLKISSSDGMINFSSEQTLTFEVLAPNGEKNLGVLNSSNLLQGRIIQV